LCTGAESGVFFGVQYVSVNIFMRVFCRSRRKHHLIRTSVGSMIPFGALFALLFSAAGGQLAAADFSWSFVSSKDSTQHGDVSAWPRVPL